MRVRAIVIGGGIIGSAVACELARREVGDLHVLDPDMEGTLSSTERNAGGVRHLWQHRVNAELSRVSIAYFDEIGSEIGFQHTGYLWLYGENDEAEGDAVLKKTKELGLDYQRLTPDEVQQRYPFLDKHAGMKFGVFGAKDGLINSNALKLHFRNEAKKHGVKFHEARCATKIVEKDGKAMVSVAAVHSQDDAHAFLKNPEGALPWSETETWDADFVVLCAGAWSKPLLSGLVADPGIQPVKRQLSFFKAEGFDMSPYGMVVDTSRVYFHPEGGNILAGFGVKDEPPGFRFDYDHDFFEEYIWPPLYERSTQLERLKHVSGWGGLYSYTKDGSGLLGRVPGTSSIYEAHSFTGRGIMQSHGVGVAVAELILDGKFQTIDASGLARERFGKGPAALLHEGLHI